ncbi:type II toxin-antitoxin system ParD family antitoxin [Paraburkholderia caledonica]|jgi:putative addiction module CopG family antidote|uniref:type II toxin-antitoxin system ParD family antitoxin n=2 Tax=Paraburkholderia caledonica TaxID=134536 RepID=UPI0038B9DA62
MPIYFRESAMPSKHALCVSLTERLASFIKAEIAVGRYSTASEVVRAGLRLLQEQSMPSLGSDADRAPSMLEARPDGRRRAAIRDKR